MGLDVVGDALALVGGLDRAFERRPARPQLDAAVGEEVPKEAHHPVAALLQQARVLAAFREDVVGHRLDFEGVQPQVAANGNLATAEGVDHAVPVVQRLEDDADPVGIAGERADELLFRAEGLSRTGIADGELRVAVLAGEGVDDNRASGVLVDAELDAAVLEDRRGVRRGKKRPDRAAEGDGAAVEFVRPDRRGRLDGFVLGTDGRLRFEAGGLFAERRPDLLDRAIQFLAAVGADGDDEFLIEDALAVLDGLVRRDGRVGPLVEIRAADRVLE